MLHVPFIADLHLTSDRATDPARVTPVEAAIVLAGRACFAAIFIASGLNHLLNYAGTVAFAMSAGVAFPGLMVPLTGFMILAGGLMVLLGLWARLGALLIVAFLIPTSVIMHRFWGLADAGAAANQMAHFMKNLALAGGALLIMYFGPGPFSVDHEPRRETRPPVAD